MPCLAQSRSCRTQGRNAQNTQDATIATATLERAKLWRESASATIPVGPPLVQPPARSGAKAAFAFSSLSDTERPPGVSLGAAGR
jgi:hypothetical protein